MSVNGELIYFAQFLPKHLRKVEIVPISDIHKGNRMFDLQSFRETVRYIRDVEEAYTILNGDLIEAAIRSSLGDIFVQVGTPQEQAEWVIKELLPIKHKILGMTWGNHERRIYNQTGVDMSLEMAKKFECPYRPEGILLKIVFGSNNKGVSNRPYSYFGYATHGYGGARTASAKAVKVERTSTHIHADFYLMSHDHVANGAPVVYLMPDPRTHVDESTGFTVGAVTEKRKILVKTNAHLKWGGYSEMGGFPPVDLATPIITLAGQGKPRVNVTI